MGEKVSYVVVIHRFLFDTQRLSHHKLSDGSSLINLNITSSQIEGGDYSGRELSKEPKAVEDLEMVESRINITSFVDIRVGDDWCKWMPFELHHRIQRMN
ncbi:hypothetical protein Bca4012_059131 [Brassica carinata]